MNQEKIGGFIVACRKDKNLTQEQFCPIKPLHNKRKSLEDLVEYK